MLHVNDLEFRVQGEPLFDRATVAVNKGDRVGLVGNNRVGKTTLLRILLGELEPQAGTVRLGVNLEIAYFDQLRSEFDPTKTVAEARKSSATIYKLFLAYLRAGDFPALTWPASSSRWAGPGRGGTPTTRAGASTTGRPGWSCLGPTTPRRRQRRRCSTAATPPHGGTRSTSG